MKITAQESNHFNFIRLFAAFLVFYGHAYIFMGHPISIILNHEMGLFIFFSISGYLISLSWSKDPSIIRYIKRRSLRIFPALIVVVLLSIFILGPIMTTWPLDKYFSSPHLYSYFKNIFLYISYYLPGVFEHNVVANAVNGSLWSLPAEFLMYLIVIIIGQKRLWTKYLTLLLFIIFGTLTIVWARVDTQAYVIYNTDVRQVLITGTYFWAGALLFHWNIKRLFSFESFVIVTLFLFFIYQWSYIYSIISMILIPFLVLTFGFSNAHILKIFNKFDYSYGFYIYAFPVQQSIIYLYPNITPLFYLISGFVLTMLFAALSWHFVEEPMMKFKPKKSS